MSDSLLAVLCALGAALCIAVGTVVRQRSASTVSDEEVGPLRPITTLVRKPEWWLGTLVGFGGYGLPFIAVCLLLSRKGSRSRRALMLGLASGALFGVAAVLTKGVVHLAGRGIVPLLTSVELYALIVVAVVAISVQQSAFQIGALQASLPATTVMEPMVASLLGFVVLGEYLHADRAVYAILVAALAATVAAAIALARGAAKDELVDAQA